MAYKLTVEYKNGKTETFTAKYAGVGIMDNDNMHLDIGFFEEIIRRPNKHPVEEITLDMRKVKKLEIIHG